jgi:hypothetical protein
MTNESHYKIKEAINTLYTAGVGLSCIEKSVVEKAIMQLENLLAEPKTVKPSWNASVLGG